MVNDSDRSRQQLIAELCAPRQDTDASGGTPLVARRLAVERVRAEAMAMRQSGDLVNVLGTMWQEMVGLGIEIYRLNVRFIEGEGDEARIGRSYYTIPNPRRYGISWTSPALVEYNDEMTVGEIATSGPRDSDIIASWREFFSVGKREGDRGADRGARQGMGGRRTYPARSC